MPITQSLLTDGSSLTETNSYTTASISPSANQLVLVAIQSIDSPSVGNTPTLSGASMTWVEVASVTTRENPHTKLTLFRGLSASPESGVLTIDFAGQDQFRVIWAVSEFDSVDTGGANGADAVVQAVTEVDLAAPTSLTVTLAAFGSTDNATYGTFVGQASSTTDMTPGTVLQR